MRLRFTIRDLLWLALVVALAVGVVAGSPAVWKYVLTESPNGTAAIQDVQTGDMWFN